MEPISRPPKVLQATSPLRYYSCGFLFFFIITYCSMSLILVQIMAQFILLAHWPALLFGKNAQEKKKIKRIFFNAYRSVIVITEQSFGSMIMFLVTIFTPGTQLVLTGDFELLKETKKAIIMSNHQIYPDWLYLWTLARHAGRHGDLKIMLIAILQYLPLFGLGMTFFEFIFLKQKLAKDRKTIIKHMNRQKTLWKDFPLWLLIFPEGTLNTPNNRETSRAYAKKTEMSEDPKYVILPKGTGLFMIADALADEVDVLFDLTVGYSGLEKEDIPYEEYLIDKVFWRGNYPKQVHIHIQKYNLKQIPGLDTPDVGSAVPSPLVTDLDSKDKKSQLDSAFDEKSNERRLKMSDWLKDRFMEKDDRMKDFYEKKQFPGSSLAVTIYPNAYDCIVVLSIGACSWIIVPFWWFVFKALWKLFLYPLGY